jgi:hypothetical protein
MSQQPPATTRIAVPEEVQESVPVAAAAAAPGALAAANALDMTFSADLAIMLEASDEEPIIQHNYSFSILQHMQLAVRPLSWQNSPTTSLTYIHMPIPCNTPAGPGCSDPRPPPAKEPEPPPAIWPCSGCKAHALVSGGAGRSPRPHPI